MKAGFWVRLFRGNTLPVLSLWLLLGAGSHAQGQTNEYRGLWAEAWSSDLWTASSISRVVTDLRAGNFNALVAQVRRRGDALYTSHYEPKCADISSSFDPLADLVAKAHNTNNGPYIEVHAWIVTYHVWQSNSTYHLPPQTNHPLNLHPDWLLKDMDGKTLINKEFSFDPGHPEVQKHTFNVCMDIITNYNVDGLNFDYIRYAGISEGYNDVTVARFNRLFNRSNLPPVDDAVWKQFRRDQVTALLRKVYLNAIAVRPEVKISCDTITWSPSPTDDATWYSSSAAWNNIFQDWRGWMEEGILDLNIPMTYFRQNVHPQHYANWSNFAKDHRFGRQVVIGPGIYLNSVSNAILQMRMTRDPSPDGNGADGVCGYDYQVTNSNGVPRTTFFNALVAPSSYDPIAPPMFAQPASIPPMPWKTAPTKGHLKGFVSGDSATNTLDGAVVTLTGPVIRAQTNDATGFYGFVDLPPGTYTVTASYPGYAPATNTVSVSTGVVATRDLLMTSATAPVIDLEPQSQTVTAGQSAHFSVSASGTPELAYQWRFYGTNLAGATASTLDLPGVSPNQAGPYVVVVTNSFGAVTSGVATLTVTPTPPGQLRVLWNLAPNSRPYLTVNSLPYERCLAHNPVTERVLVASRNGPGIYVLDAATGADLHQLNMTGVSGGTYPLLMLGVAADGVVYAANLTLGAATDAFRLYRWQNDTPGTVPTVAFSGDPSPGNVQRWGDTLDVRGWGPNTQILIGSRSGSSAVVFATANGTNFSAHAITVAGAPGGCFGLGIAFGEGNTLWGKASGQPLRQIGFDLSAGTGSILQTHGSAEIPDTVAPIGVAVSPVSLVAGINISSRVHLRLYDLPQESGTLTLVSTNNFPTDNDDTATGTGAVDFAADRVFALAANNGILALRVIETPSVVPQFGSVVKLPGNLLQLNGSGDPGTYTIESSTNLVNWLNRTSFFSTVGGFQWVDATTNAPRQFYRARWSP